MNGLSQKIEMLIRPVWIASVFALAQASALLGADEATTPWEFLPYRVEVWCAFDPSLEASPSNQQQLIHLLRADVERAFQAACNVECRIAEPEMATKIQRQLDSLKPADLTAQDLVLVIGKSSEQPARSFEAAIDKYESFAIGPGDHARLKSALERIQAAEASSIGKLKTKLQVVEGGLSALKAGVADKSLPVALVPRYFAPSMEGRVVSVPLPWHMDVRLRAIDKVMLVHVGASHSGYQIRVRELDCPMQYMGPTISRVALGWDRLSRTTSGAIVDAFAPIARVEEAERRTANLRLRAGGLITSPDNPASIELGELMHPIMRRDDRNGNPLLIEAIPWTYAAITQTDGIKMKANIYTYSGGPGVGIGKNRRIQSMLLKVRPQYAKTDVQLRARDTKKPLPACEVYLRDLESDEMLLLGRSDWRGRLTVTVPEKAQSVQPEYIRAAKAAAELKARIAKEQAEMAAREQAMKAVDQGASDTPPPAESAPPAATAPTPDPASVAPAETPAEGSPTEEAKPIPLKRPLLKLYVKSGDLVLAQLPLVPGVNAIETADLPDDSRRLEAEGLMNGFQSEVLSLIGTRSLLLARVNVLLRESVTRNSGTTPEQQQEIWDKKLKEAEEKMSQLRKLPDFGAMLKKLDAMQKRILDESSGSLSVSSKARIDRLFQMTREMLEKFLQDDTVREAEANLAKRLKEAPRPQVPPEQVEQPEGAQPAQEPPKQ